MLNTAFLTQDILILHKFHFFIKDLHMRLEQMHSFYKLSLESRVFTVYRGLSMPLEKFEKTIRAEVKNLIAFDSFLSTSLDDKVANRFALNKRDPKDESIVFHMEIDADQMKRPFADISRWSEFNIESEVLFSIGTVFRIDDVENEKNSEGIWIVHLSTVSEKDEQLQKETQQIQSTLLDFFTYVLNAQNDAKDERTLAANNANVASMYYKQGEYEESLLYYKKALEALRSFGSPDPLTEVTYISNIAKVHRQLHHDNEALTLYQEALDILRHKSREPNDPSLIHTLHTIGDIYREKHKWNEALEQYQEALERQLSFTGPSLLLDPSSIAATYICIGTVLYHQKKHQEALDSFLKALEQQHEHLSEQHPVLAFLYNNIGAMYYKIKQYDQALENQLKCLKIELKALPKEHKTFAETYKNIATTYLKLQQFDQAMTFAQKWLDQLKAPHSQGNTEDLSDAIYLLQRIQMYRDIQQ